MICPKCQHNNDKDAKFCEKCGTSLKKPIQPSKSNGISTTTLGLIIVCIILVAGLGITVGYILNGSSEKNSTTQASNTQISTSTGFPVSEAPSLAAELSKSNGNIQSVQYKGITLDKNQCLYILAKSVVLINNGEGGYVPIKHIGSAEAPYGELNSAPLTKSEYVDMADRTYKWIDANGLVPNHTGIIFSGSPDMSPDLTLKAFMKALTEYKTTGQLPQNIVVP